MTRVVWENTRCIEGETPGGSKCARPERHPVGKPMFRSREEGREAIGSGPPWPCHKCLMAFAIERQGPWPDLVRLATAWRYVSEAILQAHMEYGEGIDW